MTEREDNRCPECGWLFELGHAQSCTVWGEGQQDYDDEAWEREAER